MRFITRRDTWLSIVIWLCIATLLLSGLSPFIVDEPIRLFWKLVLLLFTFSFAFLMAWIWIGTSYELQETALITKFGPFTKRVPYSTIKKARPVRSWTSSAATSINRVELSLENYDIVFISPLEKDTFLQELKLLLTLIRQNLLYLM